MKLTASKLRTDIFNILDTIIETGEPVEIERNGVILKIVATSKKFGKLEKLKKRKITDEDSDSFTHIDWSSEWSEGK